MIYLLYALHILVCVFLILVVLLQQGKGADLSVFGGGSTQTAFGARGAATLLHKLTVASFVVFIMTTMGIALMSGLGGTSVIDGDVEETAPLVPVPPPAPSEVPGGTGVPVPFEDQPQGAVPPAEEGTPPAEGEAP